MGGIPFSETIGILRKELNDDSIKYKEEFNISRYFPQTTIYRIKGDSVINKLGVVFDIDTYILKKNLTINETRILKKKETRILSLFIDKNEIFNYYENKLNLVEIQEILKKYKDYRENNFTITYQLINHDKLIDYLNEIPRGCLSIGIVNLNDKIEGLYMPAGKHAIIIGKSNNNNIHFIDGQDPYEYIDNLNDILSYFYKNNYTKITYIVSDTNKCYDQEILTFTDTNIDKLVRVNSLFV